MSGSPFAVSLISASAASAACGPETAVRAHGGHSERRQPLDGVVRVDAGQGLGVLVEGQLGNDRERRDVLHRPDRSLELVKVVERLHEEEVDPAPLEEPRLLVEDGKGVLGVGRVLEVAERPDRAPDQHGGTGDLARLARELDAPLDDLLELVVQELRRELAAVGAEGVRLDQLGARADEARVDGDDRLGRFEVRLLGAAQPWDERRQERAGAAVADDDAVLGQALEEPAHEAESTRVGSRREDGSPSF